MSVTSRRSWLCQSLSLTALAWLNSAQAQDVATMAAASDLQFALETLLPRFEQDSGLTVRLVFGSSGQLATQIQQGAPFHLFLSADEQFVFKLADAGKTVDRGRLYALGRIGLLVPHGSPLQADGSLADLGAALRDGRVQKFAIANPAHAPYGLRAQEALTHAGLWPAIQPKLVLGENISQTAQFALSGATQGGIVAQSLALAPAIAQRGRFALIPATWHQPLAQRMVLLKDAPPAAQAFYRYLQTPDAQALLARFGFVPPAP
ncbi:MAG TPA: molybdate ABC transporter substrate-binding protein [Burkholderiaceae bacterium]|nr:molybdate ABC transporter substrate-binding protein [Burkholderiaceae bacterium]